VVPRHRVGGPRPPLAKALPYATGTAMCTIYSPVVVPPPSLCFCPCLCLSLRLAASHFLRLAPSPRSVSSSRRSSIAAFRSLARLPLPSPPHPSRPVPVRFPVARGDTHARIPSLSLSLSLSFLVQTGLSSFSLLVCLFPPPRAAPRTQVRAFSSYALKQHTVAVRGTRGLLMHRRAVMKS